MGLNQIMDGHIKELLGQEQDLYESRIKNLQRMQINDKG